jgi:hypothetical protein
MKRIINSGLYSRGNEFKLKSSFTNAHENEYRGEDLQSSVCRVVWYRRNGQPCGVMGLLGCCFLEDFNRKVKLVLRKSGVDIMIPYIEQKNGLSMPAAQMRKRQLRNHKCQERRSKRFSPSTNDQKRTSRSPKCQGVCSRNLEIKMNGTENHMMLWDSPCSITVLRFAVGGKCFSPSIAHLSFKMK